MPTSPSKPARVDAHFHVFAAGQGQAGARYVPAYDAPLDRWQAAAGPAGISHGVLVQPSFLGTDNTRLCAELRDHPGLLRGVAVVAPLGAAGRLAPLHALGVRGVRLNLAGTDHALGGWAGAAAAWDELLALGWHVELHTDVGGLPAVLAQVPAQVPVVVDHMGKPDAASAHDPTIACLRARARQVPVHAKLSGAYRLGGRDARAVARVLQGELGDGALLWGSDWPCTNHEACADYPRLLDALWDWVGPQAAAAALGANALQLYWADRPGTQPA